MRFVLAVMGILGLSQAVTGQANPASADLLRLAEAFRLARAVQATVWPGWDTAPFPVLLVTSDREFLAGNAKVPPGFASAGYSAILQAEIWSRPRQFDPGLLATFPAFGPPPVIVIGRAEVTKKASTAWVLTVLHEHFHQYQMSDSRYFSAVEQLELSGGDQTGMWMLNYPFPYQSVDVAGAFAAVSRELAHVLGEGSRPGRQRFWQTYAKFLEGLSERDRRYLSFQVWQEGVARYVELRVAEVAASACPDLQKQQRISFYAFGAGLALLLDQDSDTWKSKYLTEKFFVERYAGVR